MLIVVSSQKILHVIIIKFHSIYLYAFLRCNGTSSRFEWKGFVSRLKMINKLEPLFKMFVFSDPPADVVTGTL